MKVFSEILVARRQVCVLICNPQGDAKPTALFSLDSSTRLPKPASRVGCLELILGINFLGDFNSDGIFDSTDLIEVFQRGRFNERVEGNSYWQDGDWNADGIFSAADLSYAYTTGYFEESERPRILRQIASKAKVDELFAADDFDLHLTNEGLDDSRLSLRRK